MRTLVAKDAYDASGITPQDPGLSEQSFGSGRRVDIAGTTQRVPGVAQRWFTVSQPFAHAPIVEGTATSVLLLCGSGATRGALSTQSGDVERKWLKGDDRGTDVNL